MSSADLADFAPKDQARPRSRASGLLAPGFAWALVLAILAFLVPKFEAIFKDFGIELSVLTKVIVKASHLSPALLGLVVVLMVVDSIVRDHFWGRKGDGLAGRAWSTLMFGLPLFALCAVVLAIGTTLIGLISKLSG